MGMPNEMKDGKEPADSPSPSFIYNNNAPKYGTVIPNRIFVGGITSSTTEDDLIQLFTNYGNVVNSKIIVDRAGVSKGYGFVTFESEEEARRLQKDADNIVLKERKLNIAPAIRKQIQTGYRSYEGVSAGPGSPGIQQQSQVFRQQNGVTYTFLNGVAYFPHQAAPQAAQSMTPITNHVEHSPVYPPAGPYSGLPQSNSGQGYNFSYTPQSHVYYQATYPYPMPYDGCYQIGDSPGVMAIQSGNDSGGLIYPQYYLTHQPTQPDVAYFQPQGSVQPLPITQEQLMYSPQRGGYDAAAIFYSEPKMSELPTPPPQQVGQMPPQVMHSTPPPPKPQQQPPPPQQQQQQQQQSPKDEAKTGGKPHKETVVSISKMYDDYQQQFRSKFPAPKRKIMPRHLNNNNPDVTNRNVGKKMGPRPAQILNSIPPPRPFLVPNHNSSSIQVPQFPFMQSRPPYHNQVTQVPSYYPTPPRRTYYNRNKFSVRNKTCPNKWYKDHSDNGPEEGGCVNAIPLTPPVTPRAPQDLDITSSQGEDAAVSSIQALTI